MSWFYRFMFWRSLFFSQDCLLFVFGTEALHINRGWLVLGEYCSVMLDLSISFYGAIVVFSEENYLSNRCMLDDCCYLPAVFYVGWALFKGGIVSVNGIEKGPVATGNKVID